VLARLIGPRLLAHTGGALNRILSRRFNVASSGDKFIFNLFDVRVLATLRICLLLTHAKDMLRLFGGGVQAPRPLETITLRKILLPEKYWSGCPPNLAPAPVF